MKHILLGCWLFKVNLCGVSETFFAHLGNLRIDVDELWA
jgi:hypothetical protein